MGSLLKWLSVALALAPFVGSTQELTANDIKKARKIYVVKCAKCHKFYEPNNYSAANWGTWMEKMSAKAKLKKDQERLLIKYLDAYRAGRLPGKPQDRPSAGR